MSEWGIVLREETICAIQGAFRFLARLLSAEGRGPVTRVCRYLEADLARAGHPAPPESSAAVQQAERAIAMAEGQAATAEPFGLSPSGGQTVNTVAPEEPAGVAKALVAEKNCGTCAAPNPCGYFAECHADETWMAHWKDQPAPPPAAPETECPPGCCEHTDDECDFARANREAFRALAADRRRLEGEVAEWRAEGCFRLPSVEEVPAEEVPRLIAICFRRVARLLVQNAVDFGDGTCTEDFGCIKELRLVADALERGPEGEGVWVPREVAEKAWTCEAGGPDSCLFVCAPMIGLREEWLKPPTEQQPEGAEGKWLTMEDVRMMLAGCLPEFLDPLKMLLLAAGIPADWLAPAEAGRGEV